MGEFSRGNENESARSASTRSLLTGRQSNHHRQCEGEGLSATGSTSTENVAAVERIGKGRSLDREGIGDADLLKHVHDGFGHAEIGESGGHERKLLGGGGKGCRPKPD